MALTCFTLKNIFLACILCEVVLILKFNISLNWNNIKFRRPALQSAHLKVFVNNNNNSTLQVNSSTLVQEITNCYDQSVRPTVSQRGHFWVFYNYIRAEKRYTCSESVTYTTQADYTFLDNLVPLTKRWKGPISVALHAPGYDFQSTLDSIAYLRNCDSDKYLIKQFVTFHLFFHENHFPENISSEEYSVGLIQLYKDTYNCSKGPPYKNKALITYKATKSLMYPINVARNIARTSAQTHFVLASDIELYPTPNLITKFLRMVVKKRSLFEKPNPKIFVLPVFEILENERIPNNKTVLRKMIAEKKAFYFHQRVCLVCHRIPNATEWISATESNDLDVFVTTKRQGTQQKWEAFYIGTQAEPLFDERLTWEGQHDRMSQAYIMCLLDYDYIVLDNVFLTHKPGIKNVNVQKRNHHFLMIEARALFEYYIKPELRQIYGENDNCTLPRRFITIKNQT